MKKGTIVPKVFEIKDYTFVTGYSDLGTSIGAFYKNEEFYYRSGTDALINQVLEARFNDDEIPDFVIMYLYEDFGFAESWLSVKDTSFTRNMLGDFHYADIYCPDIPDSLTNVELFSVYDVNADGFDEVVVNASTINDKYIPNSCTDTIFIKNNRR